MIRYPKLSDKTVGGSRRGSLRDSRAFLRVLQSALVTTFFPLRILFLSFLFILSDKDDSNSIFSPHCERRDGPRKCPRKRHVAGLVLYYAHPSQVPHIYFLSLYFVLFHICNSGEIAT